MVVSSRPIKITAGSGPSGAAATAIALRRSALWLVLPTKQAKQAIPIAQVMAGMAMDKQMIWNILRALFDPPEFWIFI